LVSYYVDLLTEENCSRGNAIHRVTSHIPSIVTNQHNVSLMHPITLQEVDIVVMQMKEDTTPGPDGFTINFFHACWDILKLDVLDIVEESHNRQWVLPALNATFLTLIPKEENVVIPSKYRPIALCNVIYKIITKVIANRLKPLLPFLISPEKTGYVEGRKILDGIILSHEVIHSLKSTKTLGMLLKLDLSKAFDCLSWEYIEKTLLAFGFSHDWIHWILSLLSSAFFLVLVNGSPSPTFLPSRGIRQGDPLSPFLFILMVEGLSRMLKNATSNGTLKGLKLHNSQPLTHQQFVDDNLLLAHPSIQEARTLKLLLDTFSEASGATINLDKSLIFFFNTPPLTQRTISQTLGFSTSSLPSKYLGAPLITSAIKHSSWKELLDKLTQ
jgi:hypothetical protein